MAKLQDPASLKLRRAKLQDKDQNMEFIKKNKLLISFTLLGLAGGFLYWKYVGCLTGSCPIKSVWYWSTLYGGVAGYLVGSIIEDIVVRSRKKRNSGE